MTGNQRHYGYCFCDANNWSPSPRPPLSLERVPSALTLPHVCLAGGPVLALGGEQLQAR